MIYAPKNGVKVPLLVDIPLYESKYGNVICNRFYLFKIGEDYYKMKKLLVTSDGLFLLICTHKHGKTCAPLRARI